MPTPDEALDAQALRGTLSALSDAAVAPATTASDNSERGWWWSLFEAQAAEPASSIWRPVGCSARGAGSTRSPRPATRRTPWWRWPCGRPTRRCCTTDRAASTALGPPRCPARRRSATSCRVCSGLADEPIAGGRHKVFGHGDLAIIPQTSTIASHLPRAVGLALSLHRAHRLGDRPRSGRPTASWCAPSGTPRPTTPPPSGAINSALNAAFRGLPVPLLFLCEDNGLGISVPTPAGWIEHAYGSRPGLTYVAADGADPESRPWLDRARCRGGSRAADARSSCTCAPCAFSATPAATSRSATARPRWSRPSWPPTRSWAPPVPCIGTGLPADLLARVDAVSGRGRGRTPTSWRGAELLRSGAEVVAPLAPRRPERGGAHGGRLTRGSRDAPDRARSPSRSTRPWPSCSRPTAG